jgi:hypothetical protein
MQATNFSSTTVCSEKELASARCKKENIVQLTLLGATAPEVGYPELLYALTRRRPEAKIRNVLQMSACILSSSRVVFLGLLRRLAQLLDPRKAQLCYTVSSARTCGPPTSR